MIKQIIKRTPHNRWCTKCKKAVPITEFDRSDRGKSVWKYACRNHDKM